MVSTVKSSYMTDSSQSDCGGERNKILNRDDDIILYKTCAHSSIIAKDAQAEIVY